MPNSISSPVDVPVRYDLAESTSPALELASLVDPTELAGVRLGHGTSRGDEELRELIAREAGAGAEQVLVTVGVIAALHLVANVTCRPGDRVTLATPCFPPSRSMPERIAARVEVVPLSVADGHRLAADRLAEALMPQTKLVSLAPLRIHPVCRLPAPHC